jgi:hypothetical protein
MIAMLRTASSVFCSRSNSISSGARGGAAGVDGFGAFRSGAASVVGGSSASGSS